MTQRRASSPAAHRVRIIAGRWRRTPIAVADVDGLRPTPDRVRETLFNWLGARVAGMRCLDLFAGTGALGLEAASRGAAQVLLVERDRRARAAIARMIDRLDAHAVVRLAGVDAQEQLRRLAGNGERFDLAFVDPPFGADCWQRVLAGLPSVLSPDGLVYLECDASFIVPERWQTVRAARAGQVRYHLLQRADPIPPAPPGNRDIGTAGTIDEASQYPVHGSLAA